MMSDGPTVEESGALRQTALRYIEDHNTVSVATREAEGVWASTVFYANVGFTLYFLSEPKTRHAQNVAANPAVAATINEDYRDWQQIKGIQMSAICTEVTGKREVMRALASYVKKYPFVKQFLSPGQLLRGMQVAGRALDVRLYRLAPTSLLFIDNQRGFSNRQEISVEAVR
ncbi:MAG: hypothetical protein HW416_621 [Chloroflexi bacterium]|nr:hypothetical protein [Chloroflexota bacterium]